MNDIVGTKLL